MPLIRSANSPSLTPFSMARIEDQARAILSRAREQADQLLAAAQAEAQAIKAQAHVVGQAEGREEGLRQGREQGAKSGHEQALADHRARLSAAVSALASAMQQLDASRLDLESAAVSDVIRLAIEIARRVTKRLGQINPQVMVGNVAEAMKLVSHASEVRIGVHPSQKEVLDREMPALKLQWPNLRHVAIVEDASLAPGGCRVFTAQGQIDGDLDEQLNRIVSDLLPDTESLAAAPSGALIPDP
jgi:flagellar assembly protein FliH